MPICACPVEPHIKEELDGSLVVICPHCGIQLSRIAGPYGGQL